MPQFHRVLTTALVLCGVLAADAHGQQLLEVDGIELRGEAQLVLSGGGTCNVLESDTSYEDKQENHGAPMDVWRLDFSVRNGSGRWLDHLIARFQIASQWPDCTNWDGPDAGSFPQNIEWADSIGTIQESGRNVVAPDQTLTETRYFIVLRGDPEPRFSNWSMDFDFAAAPPTANSGAPAVAQQAPPPATAEQENIFWQSIADSENPAMFEAYLAQFPNGVFRALAEARLAELRAPTGDSPTPAGRLGGGAGSPAAGVAARRDVRLRPGENFRDCDECPEMVVMPDGNLALGRYEVTVGEYRAFASATGRDGGGCWAWPESDLSPTGSWRQPGFRQTDRHPVACVNWDDAQAYVSWLSRRTGAVYRLPTVAEWVSAATGSEPGCYTERTGFGGTCPVGSYGTNAAGLSDMLGNVWEFTEDCYEGGCAERWMLGGSFYPTAERLRRGPNSAQPHHRRYYDFGFRVAKTLD